MRTVKEFIENLSNEDIDLVDKLDNLDGAGQISDKVYELASEKDNFETIEHFVREILQDDIGDTELAEEYIEFIVDETESLYEQGLIDEADDFTGGLYNCDDLYLYAIADALDLDMDELKYYGDDESEEDE